MEEMDKRIMEVARNAVKECLENLINTERDAILEKNCSIKNGFYGRSDKTKFEDRGLKRNKEQRMYILNSTI